MTREIWSLKLAGHSLAEWRAKGPGRARQEVLYRAVYWAGPLMKVLYGSIYELDYLFIQRKLAAALSPKSTTAVCIHLYYLDAWPLFARKLGNLHASFDLFVTLPKSKQDFAETIHEEFPNAYVTGVPNHGRGTLPFTKTAEVLLNHGYEVALKLHCATPTKLWGDEQRFLELILHLLLPETTAPLDETIRRLRSTNAAIVGPSDLYIPLTASFGHLRRRIGGTISRLVSPGAAREVLETPERFGFFAGTMFWVRLEAIEPLLRFRAFDFEPEVGRHNRSTFAHVLERVFSLVPRLHGWQILELAENSVQPREAESHDAQA